MKRLGLSTILICTIITCVAQSNKIKNSTLFPNTFELLASEIPSGFVIQPISQEAKSMGITSNPAVVTDANIISSIYDGVNIQAVSGVLMAMYVQPHHDQELGVYIVGYKSLPLLKNEIRKLTAKLDRRYFTKDKYLFIIWSDAGSYKQQVNFIAERLKRRLNLVEVKVLKQ
ncbi:hypothetical protein HH214_12060 [Mucilaginibacter robiniae]|uniref:Uncharacterized protein n=1 Tax=Mucilaginibacter robiniae TaxID=2728022 RepID=A0A7L5E2K6_9SPHI|nr:hypothetical protein [Mucilaginibacter robiniae]QJD96559.1 hypothetical protein HH214_12060 [Mucilaginibacter robiniae]